LTPFQELADMLLGHLDGILNYLRTKVPLGVVEAIYGDIKSLLPWPRLPEPALSPTEGAAHGAPVPNS
jgi:hypothetical protein